MEQKITPGIMVIASILVIATLIMGSILVTAVISNTNQDSDQLKNTESQALRLIPTIQSVDDEDDEEDDDENDADEPEDVPITGTPLEKASAAALEAVGEGRVTDTEVGDEDGYYEIEITLDNGNEVDIHLDENFNVISKEYD
jgi:uncharacterized membrane protein YkoI